MTQQNDVIKRAPVKTQTNKNNVENVFLFVSCPHRCFSRSFSGRLSHRLYSLILFPLHFVAFAIIDKLTFQPRSVKTSAQYCNLFFKFPAFPAPTLLLQTMFHLPTFFSYLSLIGMLSDVVSGFIINSQLISHVIYGSALILNIQNKITTIFLKSFIKI